MASSNDNTVGKKPNLLGKIGQAMAGKVKKGASGDVSGIMKKLTNIPGMKAPSLIAKSPTEEGSKLNVVEIKEEES